MQYTKSMSHTTSILIAQQSLSTTFSQPVELRLKDVVVDYPGAASTILRCQVLSTAASLPPTVIIKRSNLKQGHLFHDWVALDFLNALPEVQQMVPRLYGGNREHELLVMQDLGPKEGHLLGTIVEGDDPVQAQAALIAFQQALGALHGATMGRNQAYEGFRLRHQAERLSRHRIHRIVEALDELPEILNGIALSRASKQELESARKEITEPGPFLCFTHGDSTLSNAFYTDGAIHLFDFETAAFRHALLDGTFSRLRYLHSVWARHLPLPIQQQMQHAYRQALIDGCPQAADDRRFEHAFICCAAAWMAGLCSFLPTVTQQDKRWGRSTLRQRIVAALEHFVYLAEELNRFPALAESAHHIAHQLRKTWPASDCQLPLAKAFREAGATKTALTP